MVDYRLQRKGSDNSLLVAAVAAAGFCVVVCFLCVASMLVSDANQRLKDSHKKSLNKPPPVKTLPKDNYDMLKDQVRERLERDLKNHPEKFK